MLSNAVWLILLALQHCASAAQVQVQNGTLEGSACSSGATQYLSVPYAQPPIGKLRFQPPRPVNQSFNGTYDATSSAPNCLQFGPGGDPGTQSEDCLYLDIWTPSNGSNNSLLPVKVWLYGGSDVMGGISNPLYDGCNLAETDAIVVSINYRLGPLGWIPFSGANISANLGMLDQLQGLRYVQENIRAFGGDSSLVMLFGQSAGAIDAFAISSLPESVGLVNAVICESTGGRIYPTVDLYQSYIDQYIQDLGCGLTNNLECLQALPASKLNDTLEALPNNIALSSAVLPVTAETPPGNNGPGPLVDGITLPSQPSIVGSKVPIILGSNALDGALFVWGTYGDPTSLNMSDYNAFLLKNFGDYADLVNQTYSVSNFSNTEWPIFEAMSTIISQQGFLCASHRGLVSTTQHNVPAYTYLFAHTPSCPWLAGTTSADLPILQSCHTAEIPFVFSLVDNLPPPNGNCSFNSLEKMISETMVSAWTSMAANAHPGEMWQQWQANSSLGLNVWQNGTHFGVVDYSVCEFWDQLDNMIVSQNGSGLLPSANSSNSSQPQVWTGGAWVGKSDSLSNALMVAALGALWLL